MPNYKRISIFLLEKIIKNFVKCENCSTFAPAFDLMVLSSSG